MLAVDSNTEPKTGVELDRPRAGLSGRTVLRETGIVEVQLEQEPAVCNIDQPAFSGPRNLDLSLLKKQWR